eukprot:364627-Chlamydomonas_euryale.AAC.6
MKSYAGAGRKHPCVHTPKLALKLHAPHVASPQLPQSAEALVQSIHGHAGFAADAANAAGAAPPQALALADLPLEPLASDPLSVGGPAAGIDAQSTVAAAPEWVAAAAGAAYALGEQPTATALQSMSALATERIQVLAAIDPQSAEKLQGHLDTALAALAQ